MSIDINKEYKRWMEYADSSLHDELVNMNDKEKLEAFNSSLGFGTGGLRGFLRAGTNGMNIHTVAQATQGLANYLKNNFKNPSVAIARDSRHNGELFVEVCVGVLAANGVKAYFHKCVESTPGLSFSVRYLHCSAGICVTASHNPAAYNGYKVYGPDGCQTTTKASNEISAEIAKLDIFEDIKMLNFEDACDSSYAQEIGPEVREAFIAAACDCSVVDNDDQEAIKNAQNLKVVYTPLHGSGYPEVVPALEQNHFSNLIVVKEQAEPNGSFPTCPYPNPEMSDTLSLGLEYCKENDADILIATDPDADRVGVVVKHENAYKRLNGNEVGILLFNYLREAREKRGDDLTNLVLVTTIVSSDLIDAIAKNFSIEIRRTLTGFKYVGEQILHLEQDGEKERFIFGFEESCGYLGGTHVRDKDGVCSSLLIAQMTAMYKAKGQDLVDVLEELYKEFGYYKNDQISVEYPGVEGQNKMNEVLSGIRDNKPSTFAGKKVISSKDYNKDTYMFVQGTRDDIPHELLPKSNVLEFSLDGGSKIIVRPSGTEPKIKVYCFAYAKDNAECQSTMESLKKAASELLS